MDQLKPSRREFTQLAAATVGGCAVAGVSKADTLTSQEIQQFESLIGTSFCVVDAKGAEHRLELLEVTNHYSAQDVDRPKDLARQQPFSLLFSPAESEIDCGESCQVRHPELGSFPLLFTEVDQAAHLEVVFG